MVHDASSQRLFFEDLNLALFKPDIPLQPHIDYKIWADSYQALRLSPKADISVKYHIKRLSSLYLHRAALYPPAPLPRQAITESPDGLDHSFDCPDLLSLKKAYPEITASVVFKAAMALVNINRTGNTHALFNNFEAARIRFPFIPSSLEAIVPAFLEASDVNGPVMQSATNLISVPRTETAIDFLGRLQAEQLELTKHAAAPLGRVIAELNSHGTGSGDMIIETHRTQFFTWVPGSLGEYEKIRITQLGIRCAVGLVVVAFLTGPRATTYALSMRWDVANYSREKTQEYVTDLETAVLWLTNEKSWNLPIGQFLEDLPENKKKQKKKEKKEKKDEEAADKLV
jgi:hypothetical protein